MVYRKPRKISERQAQLSNIPMSVPVVTKGFGLLRRMIGTNPEKSALTSSRLLLSLRCIVAKGMGRTMILALLDHRMKFMFVAKVCGKIKNDSKLRVRAKSRCSLTVGTCSIIRRTDFVRVVN